MVRYSRWIEEDCPSGIPTSSGEDTHALLDTSLSSSTKLIIYIHIVDVSSKGFHSSTSSPEKRAVQHSVWRHYRLLLCAAIDICYVSNI